MSGSAGGSAGRSAGAPGQRLVAALDRIRTEERVGVMTHIVMGYPDVATCHAVVDRMVEAGVDVIEVQIPFSDPTADGPVITAACQRSLDAGTRVADSLRFMEEVSARHGVPFLFMSYLNIAFSYRGGEAAGGGLREFVRDAAAAGASGLIVPDIPPEQSHEGYAEACAEAGIHPVHVISPNATDARLEAIARVASGMVYSTSRTGTTGRDAAVERDALDAFLDRARRALGLPIALGFGISRREQITALRGHADLAVIGTHLLRALESGGADAVGRELEGLLGR